MLETFLYACDLYFKNKGLADGSQRASLALMWLDWDAAVWWHFIAPSHPLDHLTCALLKQLLLGQFLPIDADRRARDE